MNRDATLSIHWLRVLEELPDSNRCLAYVRELPPQEARFAPPERPLPTALERALCRAGVTQLYVHQTEALNAARAGKNVVVVTGTASGKTLCYNLPVLESLLEHKGRVGALYLFPTKALCQDQHGNLLDLICSDPRLDAVVKSGIYDGDTPVPERRRIRSEANLIMSNPDMLHRAILPHHAKWAGFFESLRFVVLDELHTYRGIFGANVACVLRRLRRVCAHYGSSPQFLATSATIGNPREVAEQLTGLPFVLIDQDGAPRGRKWFCFWNPPPLPYDRGGRRHARHDAVRLLTALVACRAQTIAFALSRVGVELVYRELRELLADKLPGTERYVQAYRGGYLPEERRRIERDLFSGRLRAVISTNALELGIDVGSMDAAVLVGYPGSIASTWQQVGRAGRTTRDSLAILIARDDPLDQFLVRHPDYFFQQSPEHAVADPNNPYILLRHLLCAAFELPLRPKTDVGYFGERMLPLTRAMMDEGLLLSHGESLRPRGNHSPAAQISLRSLADNTVSIALRDEDGRTEVIATVDELSADQVVYPEAVYLHEGDTYVVREYDLDQHIAYVERKETGYYTQAIVETRVKITREEKTREIEILADVSHGQKRDRTAERYRELVRDAFGLPRPAEEVIDRGKVRVGLGELDVNWRTVAFKKLRFKTHENLGLGPVNLPERKLSTAGMWLSPSADLLGLICSEDCTAADAAAGVLNLFLQVMPLIAMTDAHDVGGTLDSSNLGTLTIFLYDRYPGGLGYCEKAYERLEQLFRISYEVVRDCPCEDGCPSCVGVSRKVSQHVDPDLTRNTIWPNKRAARLLLDALCKAIRQ